MNFNDHSHLEGMHAFLSPSKYYWINYDDEKLHSVYTRHLATQMGTRLHEFAKESILLGIKLPRTNKTLNLYVNDAIAYRMTPEQLLYYSENCFGTADAICFRRNFLRIHDLKNGVTPSSMKQLEIYAALFCLEYKKCPTKIGIELRIYQFDEVLVHNPEPEDILYIMNKIISFDKQIEKIKMEEAIYE